MVVSTKKTKKLTLRQQDPYLEREKLAYSHPLPSREFILNILAEQGVPMLPGELARLLTIRRAEMPYFERRLLAMKREGQILINRKGSICVAGKLDLVKCRVQGHRDGYGFAVLMEGTGEDIFLSEREMHKVMHGDIVMVRPMGIDRRGRQAGEIVEVLQHMVRCVVGRLNHEHGVWSVVPEEKRLTQDILIEPASETDYRCGQVVVVEILVPPDGHHQPIGRIIEVLGDYADPGMEIEIALRKYALPYQFSDAVVLQVAKSIPKKVRKKDWKDRVDLRDLPLVTIDGETARDFDDAVYCERNGRGYRLVVAIADVSFYVLPDEALDREAYERGTSVYFPRRVIPMLPEALSNGICSLKPDVERLSMVCDMQINAAGQVKSYQFYPAVMKSHARLTYTQVWEWLTSGAKDPLYPHIQTLYALFKKLHSAREKRGAIDFESSETQIVFDNKGKIKEIVPVLRNDAHRLIEECMLLANTCAADMIIKHKRKCLFRVHEGPTQEKLANLQNYLNLAGLTLGGGEKPTSKHYALLMAKIRNRQDALVLQTMLLRSMQQALYTPENNGHFGLAYEAYTHFTSPIRRYPDLLVHRVIKEILAKQSYKPTPWLQLGEHCSMAERRAEEASRDVEAWLKTYYMRDKIGDVFEGRISAVTSFGIFVLLIDVYVEGLVHISELGKDYFHYHKESQTLIGEKSGVRYQLGDAVTVKVVKADLEQSRIEFQLLNASGALDAKGSSGPYEARPNKKGRTKRILKH